MQQENIAVSIIIPVYNGAKFIKETLDSVIKQDVDKEIIIVNDGSTDETEAVIKEFDSQDLVYLSQKNKGVSAARNYGLSKAKGKYIVFFDADDKMTDGFLKMRIKALEENCLMGFSCGSVSTFPVQSKLTFGAEKNIAERFLTYDSKYNSCPSNYLIRHSVLQTNSILFNERLSSTADRFFLILLNNVSEGVFIEDSLLLYRVSPTSMSNKLTKNLVNDNEMFFKELQKADFIPVDIKSEFYFRIYYILGLGYLKTGVIWKGLKYISKGFVINPVRFIRMRLNRNKK